MKKTLIIFFITILTVSACGGGLVQTDIPGVSDAQNGIYWPTDGWRTSPAEEQGMDADRLAQMFAFIDEQNHLDIHSVLVVRNGFIVAEKYYPPYSEDKRHILYSCTKSFMSALIGIAIEDGYIEGVEETVVDFFPDQQFQNLDALKTEMKLEDLLTMRAGLAWTEGMPAYQGLSSFSSAARSRSRCWVCLVSR